MYLYVSQHFFTITYDVNTQLTVHGNAYKLINH